MTALLRRTLSPGAGTTLPYRPEWWRRLCFAGTVVAWTCRRTWRVGRWLAKRWEGVTTVVLVAALWFVMDALGDRRRVLGLGLLIFASWVWVVVMPPLFEGRRPLRSWRRRVFLYQRMWQPVMALAGLTRRYDGAELVPKIVRVRSTSAVDQVHIRVIDGQTVGDWTAKAERLAEGFGAVSCWVQPGKRRRHIVCQFSVPGLRDLSKDGAW